MSLPRVRSRVEIRASCPVVAFFVDFVRLRNLGLQRTRAAPAVTARHPGRRGAPRPSAKLRYPTIIYRTSTDNREDYRVRPQARQPCEPRRLALWLVSWPEYRATPSWASTGDRRLSWLFDRVVLANPAQVTIKKQSASDLYSFNFCF